MQAKTLVFILLTISITYQSTLLIKKSENNLKLRHLKKTDQGDIHITPVTGNSEWTTYIIAAWFIVFGLPFAFYGRAKFNWFVLPLGATTGLVFGMYLKNTFGSEDMSSTEIWIWIGVILVFVLISAGLS